MSAHPPIYTAEVVVCGGRAEGRGRSSDGALDVLLRRPEDMGGRGGGTNPEQLFAIGYAACLEQAILTVGRRERVAVQDVTITARVALAPTDGPAYELRLALDVALPKIGVPEAVSLVRSAYAVCPYANATRGNLSTRITVNGAALDGVV